MDTTAPQTPDADQSAAWLRSGTPRNGHVTIVLRRPGEADTGYIGATSSYDPIAPEEHRRGNDLPDGPWTEATVDKICAALKAIVRSERS